MEVLERNKTYQVGDFILKASDRDTLRITTDRGKITILPKADNVAEVKSIK